MILSLACTDGGLMACSLRATCRLFHDTVAPYRFRAVLVKAETRKIEDLSRTLEGTPVAERRVDHIYIRDQTQGDIVESSSESDSDHWDEYVEMKAKQATLEESIARLRCACGTTLMTISIGLYNRCAFDYNYLTQGRCPKDARDVRFPLLRSISVTSLSHATSISWILDSRTPVPDELPLGDGSHFENIGNFMECVCAERIISEVHLESPVDVELLEFVIMHFRPWNITGLQANSKAQTIHIRPVQADERIEGIAESVLVDISAIVGPPEQRKVREFDARTIRMLILDFAGRDPSY
jgi:hypothetical protein